MAQSHRAPRDEQVEKVSALPLTPRERQLDSAARQMELDRAEQTSLLGAGVPVSQIPSTRRHPLSDVQRQIIRYAHENDGMRSVEAGRIVHAGRTPAGAPNRCLRKAPSAAGTKWKGTKRAIGCCPWASSDGYEALKRLKARGYMRKDPDGRWRPTGPGAA